MRGSRHSHLAYTYMTCTQVGHFNWKRAPREWMVGLCSQPHLPGGRATLWLCGHYHASCAVHSRAGTEVVTTGAVGGVINWSQPPQVIATQPVFNFLQCVNSPPVTCDAFHSGLRVCRVRRGRIDHRFLELNAVPPALEEVFAMSDDDALALRDDARKQMLRVQLELLSRAMDLPDNPEHTRARHSGRRLSASLHCASLHNVKSAPDPPSPRLSVEHDR